MAQMWPSESSVQVPSLAVRLRCEEEWSVLVQAGAGLRREQSRSVGLLELVGGRAVPLARWPKGLLVEHLPLSR